MDSGISTTHQRTESLRPGPALSLFLLTVSSLAGALGLPVSRFGASSPFAVGLEWPLLLGAAWAGFALWAWLFAAFLRQACGAFPGRSLSWAALCHTPLLLLLGVAAAVYGNESAGSAYAFSPAGRQLFQPMARDYALAAPLAAQLLVLAGYRWRSIVRHLPVISILLVALALRVSHLAWGLPALFHPDEHRYIGPAIIIVARGDLHPHYFHNPSLMIYLTSALFWGLAEHSIAFHSLDALFNLGIPDPRGDFLQMVVLRGIVAASGVGTVFATYLAGKELVGRKAALFGACLLAVSFLHVRNSHYATNDVLATFFLALSLLFSVRIYTRGRAADYLLASLFGGLATSTKYNMGLFAVAIVVAHLGSTFKTKGAERSLGRHLLLPLSASVALAAFLAGTPYALLDHRSFLAGFQTQLGYGVQPWRGQEGPGVAPEFLIALAQGFGVIPLGLAFLGLVLGVRRKGWGFAVLLSYPLTYFLFMAMQQLFFARFAIPVLPYLAILAGYGIERLGSAWQMPLWRKAAPILLLSAAMAQPLAYTLQHDVILGRTDTRFLAAEWIDRNVSPDAAIAEESNAWLDVKFGWKGHRVREVKLFWPEREDASRAMLDDGYQYVVVTSFGYEPWRKDEPPDRLPANYRPLEERATLVATFGPGRGGADLPYALDDVYTPFWHLGERERPGPTIKIYKANDPQSRSGER